MRPIALSDNALIRVGWVDGGLRNPRRCAVQPGAPGVVATP